MKEVDEGIFLHRTNYSESSLILTLYTKHSGLRKFIFRGGKKKAHNLYPLSVSEITYFGRKESDLLQLTSAEAVRVNTFPFDPVRSSIAFFMVEILRKCIHEGEREERLYQFLLRTIDRLETNQKLTLLPLEFLIGLTDFLGLRPMLENDEPTSFHLTDGHLNRSSFADPMIESGEQITLIARLLDEKDPAEFNNRQNRNKALDCLLKYYAVHLPGLGELKTVAIVKEVLS